MIGTVLARVCNPTTAICSVVTMLLTLPRLIHGCLQYKSDRDAYNKTARFWARTYANGEFAGETGSCQGAMDT
jgi:hypothetical protein